MLALAMLSVIATSRSHGRQRRARAGVATTALAIACAALGASPAMAVVEKARPADAFVDSVGVNTHLHYTGTVYDRGFAATIRPKLVALGIRHVRDGAYTYTGAGPSTTYYQRCRSLAAAGIRFDLITTFKTRYNDATDYAKLASVPSWCANAVESFEGVNEPDHQQLPAGSASWPTQTIANQKALFAAVRASTALRGITVLGPSIAFAPTAVGNLSAFMDFGNWHPYPGGECPGCSTVYGQTVEALLSRFRAPSGTRPMIATETGYHNAVNATSGQRAVSERAAGRYMPRLLLEQFNRGFVRSYLYELIDEASDPGRDDPDDDFGLLRSDGSEKPAYRAVQSVLGLLSDRGAAFSPGVLAYTLSGQTDRVHHTLLQKRDGRFYLLLWQERSSYDTGARANALDDVDARGDRSVAGQTVRLTVATPISAVRVHRLDDAGALTSAAATLTQGALDLSVTDRVTAVELDPPG
jgi:hypothetical protein